MENLSPKKNIARVFFWYINMFFGGGQEPLIGSWYNNSLSKIFQHLMSKIVVASEGNMSVKSHISCAHT